MADEIVNTDTEIESINTDTLSGEGEPNSPAAEAGYGKGCCDGYVACPMYSGDPGCASKKR